MAPEGRASLISNSVDPNRLPAWFRSAPILVAALAVLVGCGQGPRDAKSIIREANDVNGRRLVNLYGQYQAIHGHSPKTEQAFRKGIEARGPSALEEMGVPTGDLSPLFVSERDGQPFEVRYAAPYMPGSRQALVFESRGLEGKRAVYFTGGTVVQVPESECAAYRSGSMDRLPADDPALHSQAR
jgi:hypothetical protein